MWLAFGIASAAEHRWVMDKCGEPVEPGDVIVAGGDGLGEMTVPVTAASVPSAGVADGAAR